MRNSRKKRRFNDETKVCERIGKIIDGRLPVEDISKICEIVISAMERQTKVLKHLQNQNREFTVNKFKIKRPTEQMIVGILKDTIKQHGPINNVLIPSAAKRLCGNLLEKIDEKEENYGI